MRSNVILFSSCDITYICSFICAAPGVGVSGGFSRRAQGFSGKAAPNRRREVKADMRCSDFRIRRVTIG